MHRHTAVVNKVLKAGILLSETGQHKLQNNSLLRRIEENAMESDREGVNFRESQKKKSVSMFAHSGSPLKIFRSIFKEKFLFFH